MNYIKEAPRVEKTEVFKKKLKLCKSNLFQELYNEKTLFFIINERNGVFPLVFIMKLFSTALSYFTAHSTLNFSRTFFNRDMRLFEMLDFIMRIIWILSNI